MQLRIIKTFIFKIIRPLFVKDIDSNEDFLCGICFEPVLRRYLYCSDECYKQSNLSKVLPKLIEAEAEAEAEAEPIYKERIFDPELTVEEVAKHFNEPVPPPVEEKPLPQTSEEWEQMEKEQARSEDLFKIGSRIKNKASLSAGNNLTPVGTALCNSYSHVIKSFYDFSNTVEDINVKNALKDLIYKHESMPADFIYLTSKQHKR